MQRGPSFLRTSKTRWPLPTKRFFPDAIAHAERPKHEHIPANTAYLEVGDDLLGLGAHFVAEQDQAKKLQIALHGVAAQRRPVAVECLCEAWALGRRERPGAAIGWASASHCQTKLVACAASFAVFVRRAQRAASHERAACARGKAGRSGAWRGRRPIRGAAVLGGCQERPRPVHSPVNSTARRQGPPKHPLGAPYMPWHPAGVGPGPGHSTPGPPLHTP